MLSCFSDCEETTLPGLSSLDSVLRILEVIAASDGTRDALAISGLNATARIGVEIINVIKVCALHNFRHERVLLS